MSPKLCIDVDPEVAAADEETARKIARFLWDAVLPTIIDQVLTGEELIQDGAALTAYLHTFGVNMRYLGRLAELAHEQEVLDAHLATTGRYRQKSMPLYFLELLEIEIISRSIKHMLSNYMRDDKVTRAAPAAVIVRVLNHLFGLPKDAKLVAWVDDSDELEVEFSEMSTTTTPTVASVVNGATKKKNKKISHKKGVISEENMFPFCERGASGFIPESTKTRSSFYSALFDEMKSRFSHTPILLNSKKGTTEAAEVVKVPVNFEEVMLDDRICKLSLLRRICQMSGIRIASKDFNLEFNSTDDAAVELAKNPNFAFPVSTFYKPFSPNDLVDILPRLKTCQPSVAYPDAKDVGNYAKQCLQQGDLKSAIEHAQHSTDLMQQVTGVTHPEFYQSLELFAAILIHTGELSVILLDVVLYIST